jgi:nucleoside-diphosphate-sugar epimerase
VPGDRILVTGASGFVGRAVVARLVAEGRPVTLLCRPRSEVPETVGDVRVVRVADLRNASAVAPAMEGVRRVVHLAARAHQVFEMASSDLERYLEDNVQITLSIASAAAAAGVAGFLFMSTVGVLGQRSERGRPLTEESPTEPASPYAVSKLATELSLRFYLKDVMDLVILRPTLVCGVGAKGNLLRLLELSVRQLPIPLGAVNNRRTLTGLDELAGAVLAVLRRWEEGPASGTYLIGNAQPVSIASMVRYFQAGAGRGGLLLPIPVTLLSPVLRTAFGEGTRNQILADLEIDSSRFRREFGWNPPDTTEATLVEMGRNARRRPSGAGDAAPVGGRA